LTDKVFRNKRFKFGIGLFKASIVFFRVLISIDF
jgi:hypothetical protein